MIDYFQIALITITSRLAQSISLSFVVVIDTNFRKVDLNRLLERLIRKDSGCKTIQESDVLIMDLTYKEDV
jgi:hypothetical protein